MASANFKAASGQAREAWSNRLFPSSQASELQKAATPGAREDGGRRREMRKFGLGFAPHILSPPPLVGHRLP